jgi:hypothetical protein
MLHAAHCMLAGSVNFDGWGLRTYPLQYTQLTELTMNSNRLERVQCTLNCRQRTAQCRGPQCRWSSCVCAQRVGSARLQRQSILA